MASKRKDWLLLVPTSSAQIIEIIVGVVALVLAVIRAFAQSVVIDEAASYLDFVAPSTPQYWTAAANNHVLNSLLMRLFTSWFGVSPFTVRIPALIGATIYVAFAFALVRSIMGAKIAGVILFVAMVYNPFLSDFFVAARGYGMALGFLFGAIAFAVWAHASYPTTRGRNRFFLYYSLSSLCVGLSFCSSFSFGFAALSLTATLVTWGCFCPIMQNRIDLTELVLCGTTPALIVVYSLVMRVLIRWPKGQIYVGATTFRETLESVLQASVYEPNRHLVAAAWAPAIERAAEVTVLITLILVLCHSVNLVVCGRKGPVSGEKWLPQFGAVIAATVVLTVAVHLGAHRLLALLLPKDRTALYFPALSTLFIGVVAAIDPPDMPRACRIGRASIHVLLCVLAIYFVFCTRLTYFREWQYQADVANVYAELVSLNKAMGVEDVPCIWHYEAPLNFYRRLSGSRLFKEFQGFDTTTYPRNKRAYVLFWPSDLTFISSERLNVVYRSPRTNVVIAVPSLPGNVRDDTDRDIAYYGTWTHDPQFAQAANHTLTYSNRPGDHVSFRFDGTGLKWVYTGAENRGMAEILIDRRAVAVVDQYSSHVEWQKTWRFGGLDRGTHAVEIRILETKNLHATDRFIDVDLLIFE